MASLETTVVPIYDAHLAAYRDGWNAAIERAVQVIRSAPIPEDLKAVLAIVIDLECVKEGRA
jgi:hypothetical protein